MNNGKKTAHKPYNLQVINLNPWKMKRNEMNQKQPNSFRNENSAIGKTWVLLT